MMEIAEEFMSKIKFCVSPAQHRRPERHQMVFAPNPLSLSVTEPAFESWLRDSGYLEILDQRTTDLHRLERSSTTTTTTTAVTKSSNCAATAADSGTASIGLKGVFFLSRLFSSIWTLLSLLTFNPISKLTADDFSRETPTWTLAFFGSLESYSFPSSSSQARLRVQENVKRFARNYATLSVLILACSLYQMPVSLFGLVSCLALWEVFKSSSERWGLDKHPVIRQTVLRIAQCVTFAVLYFSNLQCAVFCAFFVSYAVTILHASFRKLTPGKQPATRGAYKTATARR